MYRITGSQYDSQPSHDDAVLLLQVGRGDEQAMAALFDRYAEIVYSVALRVLRDTQSADDVLQEIFLDMWRSPNGSIAARAGLGGWLTVVARNKSIDALRRKPPSQQIDEMVLPPSFHLGEIERDSSIEKARSTIERQPAEQRKTLEMAFFDGLTHAEIAEMTGDPLNIVKTRIRNALLTLRRVFRA